MCPALNRLADKFDGLRVHLMVCASEGDSKEFF
jgi:hypothetical protein